MLPFGRFFQKSHPIKNKNIYVGKLWQTDDNLAIHGYTHQFSIVHSKCLAISGKSLRGDAPVR